MTRETRVKRRAEFQRIQGQGARVNTRSFVLIFARRPQPGPARLGITASRRLGGAVLRNRAKRLVREAFRATPDLFPDGIDLVVIVRRPPEELGLHDVVSEWRKAAEQIRRRTRDVLRACGEGSPAGG